MNDIAKKRTIEKLLEAMELEGLTKSNTTKLFGFKHTNYLSWASKEKNRNTCPMAVWEALREWSNSGLSIKEYTNKLKAKTQKLEERPHKTIANVKEDRIFDSIRMAGEDITKEDTWFNSIIWCINKARDKGIDLRVTITKLEKR